MLQAAFTPGSSFVSISSSACLEAVEAALLSFGISNGNTNGRACIAIWESLGPTGPETLEGLEQTLRLEKLVDRFDTMAQDLTLSLSSLAELRLLSSQALQQASSIDDHDIRELCERFEGSLSEPVVSRPVAVSRPHFQTAFRALYRKFSTLMLDDSCSLPEAELANLAILGMYPTRNGIDSQTMNSRRTVQSKLDLLASSMGEIGAQNANAVGSDEVASITLKLLSTTDNVPLQHLDLLQTELETLGHTLASKTHLLAIDELRQLDLCLGFVLSHVLRALSTASSDPVLQQLGMNTLAWFEIPSDDPFTTAATQ